MEQVMNNHDLVCHIYSFGYPKHRIYMKYIVNYFKFNQAIRNVVLGYTLDKIEMNIYIRHHYGASYE